MADITQADIDIAQAIYEAEQIAKPQPGAIGRLADITQDVANARVAAEAAAAKPSNPAKKGK